MNYIEFLRLGSSLSLKERRKAKKLIRLAGGNEAYLKLIELEEKPIEEIYTPTYQTPIIENKEANSQEDLATLELIAKLQEQELLNYYNSEEYKQLYKLYTLDGITNLAKDIQRGKYGNGKERLLKLKELQNKYGLSDLYIKAAQKSANNVSKQLNQLKSLNFSNIEENTDNSTLQSISNLELPIYQTLLDGYRRDIQLGTIWGAERDKLVKGSDYRGTNAWEGNEIKTINNPYQALNKETEKAIQGDINRWELLHNSNSTRNYNNITDESLLSNNPSSLMRNDHFANVEQTNIENTEKLAANKINKDAEKLALKLAVTSSNVIDPELEDMLIQLYLLDKDDRIANGNFASNTLRSALATDTGFHYRFGDNTKKLFDDLSHTRGLIELGQKIVDPTLQTPLDGSLFSSQEEANEKALASGNRYYTWKGKIHPAFYNTPETRAMVQAYLNGNISDVSEDGKTSANGGMPITSTAIKTGNNQLFNNTGLFFGLSGFPVAEEWNTAENIGTNGYDAGGGAMMLTSVGYADNAVRNKGTGNILTYGNGEYGSIDHIYGRNLKGNTRVPLFRMGVSHPVLPSYRKTMSTSDRQPFSTTSWSDIALMPLTNRASGFGYTTDNLVSDANKSRWADQRQGYAKGGSLWTSTVFTDHLGNSYIYDVNDYAAGPNSPLAWNGYKGVAVVQPVRNIYKRLSSGTPTDKEVIDLAALNLKIEVPNYLQVIK